MNTERSLQFRLIDKPLDAAGVAAMEAPLFDGFVVTETAPKTRACDDGRGVSILPRGQEAEGARGTLVGRPRHRSSAGTTSFAPRRRVAVRRRGEVR